MVQLFPALKNERHAGFFEEAELFTNEVVQSVLYLRQALHHYCDGRYVLAKEVSVKVCEQEAKADEARRIIEKRLYEGVIIQMGTEDKYALLEAIDDIADKAEILVRTANVSRLKIPKMIVKDMLALANKLEISAKMLGESVSLLITSIEAAIKTAKKIEIVREEVRELEFAMLAKIFSKKQDSTSILLKDVITLSGGVADKMEEAADRLVALALKYKT